MGTLKDGFVRIIADVRANLQTHHDGTRGYCEHDYSRFEQYDHGYENDLGRPWWFETNTPHANIGLS